jgi:diaminopimelate epimerase
MHISKYQALGNDYLVVEPGECGHVPAPAEIRLICHRHYGLGSDGLLVGPLEAHTADFGLRLFNPDGSEFEKSGNGLRIFARYLWDKRLVGEEAFTIQTPGGTVTARVHQQGARVAVEMGRVSFNSREIPVEGPARQVLGESMTAGGRLVTYSAATIGNPHCVVLGQEVSPWTARKLGPLLEHDPRFPNRTNVQFMRVLDRANVQIEIWERGVGYTLASGSSSCAAAAVARKLDLCGAEVAVHMPGGIIDITIGTDWSVLMAGAVTRVFEGCLFNEAFTVQADPFGVPDLSGRSL